MPKRPFPFRVKVCGITQSDDVAPVIRSGADAIGLNFFHASKRVINLDLAKEIAAAFRREAATLSPNSSPPTIVGVFVNPEPDFLAAAIAAAKLDMIQLHGDEMPDDYLNLVTPPILKALPWSGHASDYKIAKAWIDSKTRLSGILIDAPADTDRGGTGKLANWDLLWPRPDVFVDVPLVLAGGLKPENIADAIRSVHPEAIDVASGVESSPGHKDAEKMNKFVSAALTEWDR